MQCSDPGRTAGRKLFEDLQVAVLDEVNEQDAAKFLATSIAFQHMLALLDAGQYMRPAGETGRQLDEEPLYASAQQILTEEACCRRDRTLRQNSRNGKHIHTHK